MLRINLLPPYIYEGNKRRNVVVVWTILLLAVVAGFAFAKIQIDGQTLAVNQDKERLQPDMNEAQQKAAQATRINEESSGIRLKRDFAQQAVSYCEKTYPPVVSNIADYTQKNVLYSSFLPEGQTVSLEAYAPSLSQVGHYLMWMEHNPKISNVAVAVNGLPSFPVPAGFNGQPQGSGLRPPGAGGYDFSVTLTLLQAIAGAPSYTGAPAAAAQGGAQMPGMGAGPGMGGVGPMGPGGSGMAGPAMMSPSMSGGAAAQGAE